MIPQLMALRGAGLPLPDRGTPTAAAGLAEGAFDDLLDGDAMQSPAQLDGDAVLMDPPLEWSGVPMMLTAVLAPVVPVLPVVVAHEALAAQGDVALPDAEGNGFEPTGERSVPGPPLPVAPDLPTAPAPEAVHDLLPVGLPASDASDRIALFSARATPSNVTVDRALVDLASDPPIAASARVADEAGPIAPAQERWKPVALASASADPAEMANRTLLTVGPSTESVAVWAGETIADPAATSAAAGPVSTRIVQDLDAARAQPLVVLADTLVPPERAVPDRAVPDRAIPVGRVGNRDQPDRILPRRALPDTPPLIRPAPVAGKAGMSGDGNVAEDRNLPVSATPVTIAEAPPLTQTAPVALLPSATQAEATLPASASPQSAEPMTRGAQKGAAASGGTVAAVRTDDSNLAPKPEATVFALPDAALPLRHDQRVAEVRQMAQPMPATVAPMLVETARAVPDAPVTLTLTPEDLGSLKFEMQSRGDTIHVALTVERPETLDMLRRHVDQLTGEFRQAGFAGASFSFSGGWGSGGAGGGQERAAGAGYVPRAEETDERPLPRPGKPVRGGLDLRL